VALTLQQQQAMALAAARARAAAASSQDQPGWADDLLNNPVTRTIKNAVIDPALGLAGQVDSLTGHAASALLPSLAVAPSLRTAIDQRFATAAARGRNTPGYAAAAASLPRVMNSDAFGGPASNALTAPFAEGAAGILAQAVPPPSGATSADMSNAASDAAANSIATYSENHPITDALNNTAGALASFGDTLPEALSRLRLPKVAKVDWSAPIKAVKDFAKDAYEYVNQSGVKIAPSTVQRSAASAQNIDFNGAKLIGPNMDAQTYPLATAKYNEFSQVGADGKPVPFQDLVTLRQHIRDAQETAYSRGDRPDAMVLGALKDHVDNMVNNLGDSDVHIGYQPQAGNTLAQLMAGVQPKMDPNVAPALNMARDAWQRMSTADTMQELLRRADIRANANFVQSGQSQALVNEFKNLALNKQKFNSLSPALQQAVMNVIAGKTPGDAVMRNLGRLAPRGALMPFMEGSTAMGLLASGHPVAAATSAAVPLMGHIARRISEARTADYANRAVELGLGGGRPLPLPPRPTAAVGPAPLPIGLFGSAYSMARQPQPQPQ